MLTSTFFSESNPKNQSMFIRTAIDTPKYFTFERVSKLIKESGCLVKSMEPSSDEKLLEQLKDPENFRPVIPYREPMKTRPEFILSSQLKKDSSQYEKLQTMREEYIKSIRSSNSKELFDYTKIHDSGNLAEQDFYPLPKLTWSIMGLDALQNECLFFVKRYEKVECEKGHPKRGHSKPGETHTKKTTVSYLRKDGRNDIPVGVGFMFDIKDCITDDRYCFADKIFEFNKWWILQDQMYSYETEQAYNEYSPINKSIPFLELVDKVENGIAEKNIVTKEMELRFPYNEMLAKLSQKGLMGIYINKSDFLSNLQAFTLKLLLFVSSELFYQLLKLTQLLLLLSRL